VLIKRWRLAVFLITRRAALGGVAALPLALTASAPAAREADFLSLAQQFARTHRDLNNQEWQEHLRYRELRDVVGDNADWEGPAYKTAYAALGIGELLERSSDLRQQGWELLRRIAETPLSDPAAIALKLRLAWYAHDIDYGFLDDESLGFLVMDSAIEDLDRLAGAYIDPDKLADG